MRINQCRQGMASGNTNRLIGFIDVSNEPIAHLSWHDPEVPYTAPCDCYVVGCIGARSSPGAYVLLDNRTVQRCYQDDTGSWRWSSVCIPVKKGQVVRIPAYTNGRYDLDVYPMMY